ncbi:MAG: hypothetical protein LBT12_07490, partial [Oscillospiraceae bacterium]|nr:hypothetical protein [Oscillospiraceae bacterium]
MPKTMTAAATGVYTGSGAYTVADYLRISQEDGNDESNSITNQRNMIRAYIASSERTALSSEP